ncbi:replicative DNA helicase [Pseudomonas syringae pv. actinidiae]|uniref:Replicative DNA helicase n=1 Tax=Pseudomonas syringae pv. actinidiae TaxID=103796 RepID=M1J6N9_PSESF|nr:replicative DNA helicase [Pseudomonas syringae]AGE82415.1 replicative DNA helicase [Pseudomonas syringae pv. actinidiae]AGE82539.1 replicative DNA helicase [Pseudomonas syringae pv. actinidiae]AQX62219.1 replicative DNA helicase [Pseudomonas syringae pv. actinidiae]AQX68115.1 replicative DNA helicase [Pseudomonas syringae pv. actinidiae]AYL84059.1 replicative DNA helicase [Pseudomonas syringae pv. actinidiae str. Shaanxi_M228]
MSISDMSPPHSVEAEQALLGGLMLDNEAWDLIADRVHADDFFKREHKLIFQSISVLAEANKPFDVVTVADSMPSIEEAGGLAYLSDIARNTPSVANIKTYSDIVSNRAHLRRLISHGYACAREASDPQAVASVVQDVIEQNLFALGQGQQTSDFVDVNKMLLQVVDKIDLRFNAGESVVGVPTGIDDLDELTGGLQPADLIIVAARPSMGKTSLALNFVDPALQKDERSTVQIYSLEMPAEALIYRLLSILGHLNLEKLIRGQLEDEDWPKLAMAVAKLNSYGDRLVIDDQAGLTPSAIRARARRGARRFGKPALILIDYLQMMQCPGRENRANEISEISRSLKALAKEFQCPVVALSQLNRELERRPNKRPINADLRDSGAIEQDADLILFVYRDEVYNNDTEHKGIAELILGKHRNGSLGTVRTAFIPQHTRFANLSASTWQGARV